MMQSYAEWLRDSVGRRAYSDAKSRAAGNKAHIFAPTVPRGPYRFEESLCHLAGDIMAGESIPSVAGDSNRCRHCGRIGDRSAKARLLRSIIVDGHCRPEVARA